MPRRDHPSDDPLVALRVRSPLPVFAALFVSAVVVALGVNFLSTWVDPLAGADSSGTVTSSIPYIVLAAITIIALVAYLYWLAEKQAPVVRRVITLILPFEKQQGRVCLRAVPKLRAHEGVSEMALNWAVEKGPSDHSRLEWHGHWVLPPPGDGSPVREDAVTLLYDLAEWLVMREIADYGDHVCDGQGNLRPGDDFDPMPTVNTRLERKDLFRGTRPNYLWRYGNQPDHQKFKVPEQTTLALRSLPRTHGVAAFGKEAVRELIVRNPAGELVVRPSQIWRKATSGQARSLLRKHFGEAKTFYPLEMQLEVTVRLSQWPFIWPWVHPHTTAYQRWLLELQGEMIRHLDWDRFVIYDEKRMWVEIRDRLRSDRVRRDDKAGREADDL